ncbi:MAG: hypothetical protein K2V38_25080 [Gemmataceae bacterium]|nr:hypothetical protein [Gemmataceae bacterium]
MSASWEPGRNAVHGLIQLVDVLAIALNRFRQLSFKLPHHRDERYQAELQRLRDDYFVVTRAVFPLTDIAPQHTAVRIAYRAVAELARAGSRDETAVGDAQRWLTAVGWVLVPHAAPKGVERELWRQFEDEGALLAQHATIRQRLFAALARIGEAVPDEVVQRERLAVCSLMNEGEEPVPQDVLLSWVRETAMSPEPRSVIPPEFSPAVARQLDEWRDHQTRLADAERTSAAKFEAARDAFEAWLRVAHFTGREADRDGREAPVEETRACYVNLVLELGRSLRATRYYERVQALDPGTEGPRLLAVELLRHAVAGDRAAVAHLDAAMRDAAAVGGASAIAYFRFDLRHEVLGTRPPVPVPPGWEGLRPDAEIRTPSDFISWVDLNLQIIHWSSGSRDQRSTGKDVRNAHRLLAQLRVPHDQPFPPDRMTNGEEEAHLQNLRNACLAAVSSARKDDACEGDSASDMNPLPACQPQPRGADDSRRDTDKTHDRAETGTSAAEIASTDETEPPSWDGLGEAKRAMLTALSEASAPLTNLQLAPKAGYKPDSLRKHYQKLQDWGFVTSTKDGYRITTAGQELIPAR